MGCAGLCSAGEVVPWALGPSVFRALRVVPEITWLQVWGEFGVGHGMGLGWAWDGLRAWAWGGEG